jgi:hypothetical protein
VSVSTSSLAALLQLALSKSNEIMVLEFPGILMATFSPILENLQTMQREHCLSFAQWILPAQSLDEIPPPAYARRRNFSFPLSALVDDSSILLTLDLSTRPDDHDAVQAIYDHTSLDYGQCEGLVVGLCREFSLMQGPPETGKSYLGVCIMQVLLSCATEANLGPIVVVCYTNHALDQFCEHLIANGTEKLIRNGGQSKSEIVESKDLRHVSQKTTGAERFSRAMAYNESNEARDAVEKVLNVFKQTRKHPYQLVHKDYLKKHHPEIYQQFSTQKPDGFQTVGRSFERWCLAMSSQPRYQHARQPRESCFRPSTTHFKCPRLIACCSFAIGLGSWKMRCSMN